jgi:hypothetical protein
MVIQTVGLTLSDRGKEKTVADSKRGRERERETNREVDKIIKR